MLRSFSSHLGVEAAFGIFAVGAFLVTKPAFLAFRRRRSSHGRVFNSVTGAPEALVAVALRDLHGGVVRSTVTDRQGRFRLVAPKGDFIVEVRKFGFTFPSKIIQGKTHLDYENVLNTPHIVINEYGAFVKNIPVDPTSAKRKFHLPRLILPKQLQFWLMGLSPFLAFVAAYLIGSLLGWIIFAVFCVALVRRFLSFKPARPPYGTIKDAESGVPLEGVVVRVLDKKFNKVLETQITSPKGRYAFVVNRGSFRILMKKKGYKGVILNFNGILQDGHLLAQDVKMKPKAPDEPEEEEAPELPSVPQQPMVMGDL